jgi:integrase
MVPTKTPGVYRRGGRYAYVYYDGTGKQRKGSARTYDEARREKAAKQADVARGEYDEASVVTFAAYFREWIVRYQGRNRRGFREGTREEYRRLAENYALPYFGERLRLKEMRPRNLANFVGWLCQQTTPKGRPLADSTVENAVKPVRACLATALAEGLIRQNPTQGLSLPHRPTAESVEDEDVRPFTRRQLASFLALVHPRYRLFFRFLAATGLRISEAIALQRKHLHLDGSTPHVKVRRALVKGRIVPPKTKYGRRNVPLDPALVSELRRHMAGSEWTDEDSPAFPSTVGTHMNSDNLYTRVLKPLVEEVGAPWAAFHTFRHTCASMLFERDPNPVIVQRWLGHHSAAFTLKTYVHLLDGQFGSGLDIDTETAGGNYVATELTATDENPDGSLSADLAT